MYRDANDRPAGPAGEGYTLGEMIARDPLPGHAEDCILRCGHNPDSCRADHACDKCAGDAE
jgi:hypothetical protein